MDCCRHGSPRKQGYIRCLARLFFNTLVLIGCFSAATPATATDIPALGGYTATGTAGGSTPSVDNEAEAVELARGIALGCFRNTLEFGEATVCFDHTEIIETPPWNFDSINFWQWWRNDYVRIPVRRYPDAGGYSLDYQYYYTRVMLMYFCPSGYRFVEDGSTYQIGSPRPTCTDAPVDACPVGALTPYSPDPYPLDVDNLTPRMQTALQCLQTAIRDAGGTAEVGSAYRPTAYNRHLQEVWDKWEELRENTMPACQTRRTEVEKHFTDHNLMPNPKARPHTNSAHTRGEAIDLSTNLPYGVLDVLAFGCNLYGPDPIGDMPHLILR